jgi:tetratricopeptide (TPR) repeat protein
MITGRNIIALVALLLIGLVAVPLAAQDEAVATETTDATAQWDATDATAQWDAIDDLNDDKDFAGSFALLEPMQADYAETNDYLWRMARHHFSESDNTTDEAVKSTEIYKGFEYAKQALAIAPESSWSNGYYGILIGRVGEIEGTKQKIINSYDVKKYTLKAIELDPTYDGWPHVMGRWHFALSELSWVKRKIASLVYETPPVSSFEEAAEYFTKAIAIEPDDVRHYLWLGKSQLELDLDDAAQVTLAKAIALPAESESDKIMQAEAKGLLD